MYNIIHFIFAFTMYEFMKTPQIPSRPLRVKREVPRLIVLFVALKNVT